mgnify:CR=1 FL=1
MTPNKCLGSSHRVLQCYEALSSWISTVPDRCWQDPAFAGVVYGSGYSAWGLWSQLNTAFVLASSLNWPHEAQDAISSPMRSAEQRHRLLRDLVAYVVGSHTTGTFDTVGGGRWGARPQAPGEREHFENWHSPIWATTLAQIAIRTPDLGPDLQRGVWDLVSHDALVQAQLPRDFLDGRADSVERHGFFTSEGGSNSHPESNAWKGSLVSLARMAAPGFGDLLLAEFERTLWLSSSACPSDSTSREAWTDGVDVLQYQVGTHLSDSGAVIHHGIMHPCYSVFALFSRMQTHEFAAHFGKPYPPEAARREELLLNTLLGLVVGGRLLYPAGEDWPRWVYGQCYLAPVLAHHQRLASRDLSAYLDPALDVLLREASDSPGRLLGRRFQQLQERQCWHFDRYETDLAYSLALAADILAETPDALQVDELTRDIWLHDESAQTIISRSSDTFVSVSARTMEAPFQVLLTDPATVDLLEWNGCGSYDLHIPDLPDLAKDAGTLESCRRTAGGGFDAVLRTLVGLSPQTDGLLELRTRVCARPSQAEVRIVHRVSALRHTRISELHLHLWRFSHGQSGFRELLFTGSGGSCLVVPGQDADHLVRGGALDVPGGLRLVARGAHAEGWRVHHDAVAMTEASRGLRWTEASLPVHVDPTVRWRPGDLVCEVPVVASLGIR